jgi:hypothetical protein
MALSVDLPKILQPREPEPSIVNEKTVADFTRVVEQTGILKREPLAGASLGRLMPGRLTGGFRASRIHE